MMNLGKHSYAMLFCLNCKKGINISLVMKSPPDKSTLGQAFECDCGNSFTYLDGLFNDYASADSFSNFRFISDIYLSGTTEITIGTITEVQLAAPVPIVNKLFAQGPNGKATIVHPDLFPGSSQLLLISCGFQVSPDSPVDSISRVGELAEVRWIVYGRTLNAKIEPWRYLLVQSKDQFLKRNYLLSFLTLAIALESYVSLQIAEKLTEKGLDDSSIKIFLKGAMMNDKLFTLLPSLLGISLVEMNFNKLELQKIFETRNIIAHGKKVDLTSDEAEKAMTLVIRAILHIEYSQGKSWMLPSQFQQF